MTLHELIRNEVMSRLREILGEDWAPGEPVADGDAVIPPEFEPWFPPPVDEDGDLTVAGLFGLAPPGDRPGARPEAPGRHPGTGGIQPQSPVTPPVTAGNRSGQGPPMLLFSDL